MWSSSHHQMFHFFFVCSFNIAAAGIHACQGWSPNLFVPLYVSSVMTGCWMLSHGISQECHEEAEPVSVRTTCYRNAFITVLHVALQTYLWGTLPFLYIQKLVNIHVEWCKVCYVFFCTWFWGIACGYIQVSSLLCLLLGGWCKLLYSNHQMYFCVNSIMDWCTCKV